MNELTEKQEEEDLPENLAVILKRVKARNKKAYRDIGIFVGILICIVLPFLLWSISVRQPHFFRITMMVNVLFSLFALLSFNSWAKKGNYGFNDRDLAQLSAINDKRVLVVLLSVPVQYLNKNRFLRQNKLFEYWLPLLTPEDAHLLSKLEKSHLVSTLGIPGNELTSVILRTLEQIGDHNQLLFLKTLKFSRNVFGEKSEVHSAYLSCIAAIEARAAADRSDSQLLRPSSPNDGADTYLRPVAQKVDENADTLLRAEIGGEDEKAK